MELSLRSLYQPTVLLAMALMAVIAMMILPMPAWILDLGLAASFAIAILIFTITLFIQRPLDFSSFPTILLAEPDAAAVAQRLLDQAHHRPGPYRHQGGRAT